LNINFEFFEGNCDFESGFCNWYNEEREDDFDWKRDKYDEARKPFDGPHHDHTKGKYQ
jgi:hypothetical protein